jgi:hypothetical protein
MSSSGSEPRSPKCPPSAGRWQNAQRIFTLHVSTAANTERRPEEATPAAAGVFRGYVASAGGLALKAGLRVERDMHSDPRR